MKTRRGKQRDPLRERFWRRTIADQTRSDLTIQAYCRRNSLSPATFRFWRQELARRDAERTSVRRRERPASPTDLDRTPAFLPVRVVRDSPAPIAVGSPIEIVLPSGPIVRVTHGFSLNAPGGFLRMLGARRCGACPHPSVSCSRENPPIYGKGSTVSRISCRVSSRKTPCPVTC